MSARTEAKIRIAHELVGMTQRDDQELIDQLTILAKGEFSDQELIDITTFAATVARAQADQLQTLMVTHQ